MKGEKLVKEAAKFFRAALPTSKPVKLQFYDATPDAGECKSTPKYFIVRIRREKCGNCMLEAFYHEYAHARAWGANQAGCSDHDAHWGVEFAKIFQVVYGVG